MNSDIRVGVSFLNNRKRKKLHALIGPIATSCLIDLWLNVAVNNPSGVLEGWDEMDIAVAAGWDSSGDSDAMFFTDCLIKAGFLDYVDNVYSIHKWVEHQAWASGADARSEKARSAANARWSNAPSNAPSNATSMNEQCYEHTTSNAPSIENDARSNAPFLSSPIPSSPKQKELKPSCSKSDISSDVDFEEFYDKYPRKVAKEKARSAWKTRKAKTHFDPKEVIQAARNYSIAMDGLGKGKEYIAHPATWLNQDRWREWKKGGPEYLTAEEAYARMQAKEGAYSGGHWEEITPEEVELLEKESREWRPKREFEM